MSPGVRSRLAPRHLRVDPRYAFHVSEIGEAPGTSMKRTTIKQLDKTSE